MTLREITATYSVPERVTRMVRGVRSMRTEAGRVDLLFREKAMGTFGRGQRLGDLRRLIREYNRTAAQVFPTGQHYKGWAIWLGGPLRDSVRRGQQPVLHGVHRS